MSAPHNENTLNLACKSKYNRQRKNQVILLMITNGKKWHYIALKNEPTDDVLSTSEPTESSCKKFVNII